MEIDDVLDRLADLERRLSNIVRTGKVEEVDYNVPAIRVRLDVDLMTPWISWATRRAHTDTEWWAPEIGEQVRVISQGGDLRLGIADVALYQSAYPAPETTEKIHLVAYADGAKISYDRENSVLSVVLPPGATVDLQADNGIAFAGSLTVDGDITATGDVSDNVGALSRLRDNYNPHKHIGNMGAPTSPADAQDA